MDSILRISDLHVRFRSDEAVFHAINGIDLEVAPGKAVAIVGESGSGKSTAMTAVMRLLPDTAEVEGQIVFDGAVISSLSKKQMQRLRGKDITMIFQNPNVFLNPTKTIGQQIVQPLLYHHLATPSQAEQKVIELLRLVGFSDPESRLKNYPFEFSGGMLQRAMIAMALIAEPKLLIADEPTTALDVTVQAEILILLKKLQRELGMSLVFITHDLAVAAQVCDEIYVMYGGRLMEHIPSRGLMRNHKHPYLHGLIQSIPRIDVDLGRLPFIPGQPVDTKQGALPGCVFADRCERRMDKCSTTPPLTMLSNGHRVACWLADEEVSV